MKKPSMNFFPAQGNPTAVAEGVLFQLVYTSTAVLPFSQSELATLLTRARERNAAVGISGLLLYRNGSFMQLIEGPEGAVRETFARVGLDLRHRNCVKLIARVSSMRAFPDWSMAFRDGQSAEVQAIPGYSEFLQPGHPLPSNAPSALRVLQIFRDTSF